MTTLEVMPKKNPEPSTEELAARELVRPGPGAGFVLDRLGRLKQFTKSVLETALNEDMTEHLGHEKHQVARGAGLDQRP